MTKRTIEKADNFNADMTADEVGMICINDSQEETELAVAVLMILAVLVKIATLAAVGVVWYTVIKG